jgi:hypothetical protein
MYNGSRSGKSRHLVVAENTPTKQFHDTIIVQHAIASLATAGQGIFAKIVRGRFFHLSITKEEWK